MTSSSSTTGLCLEDRIADTVLRSYDALPAKFKPTRDANGLSNWVPLSGIVLTDEKDVIDVVAIATGMKCLPSRDIATLEGGVLHDSHAEIIVIRLFNHFLLSECLRVGTASPNATYESPYIVRQPQPPSSSLPHSPSPFVRPFALRAHWKIWMYSSEAPCGDASMELVMAQQADATPWTAPSPSNPVSTTDQTLQQPNAGTDTQPDLKGRGYFSELGAVRRKPARADAPPTLSKSCSDKLALKQCTSLLLSVTSLLIAPPSAYLDVLLLPTSQYHAAACERAFGRSGRMAPLVGMKSASGNVSPDDAFCYRPFAMRTTGREFRFSRRGGQSTDGISAGPASKASNVAVAHSRYTSEVIISGVLQGHKRETAMSVSSVSSTAGTTGQTSPSALRKSSSVRRHRGASKLSRRSMWGLAAEVVGALSVPLLTESLGRARSYEEVKKLGILEARKDIKEQATRSALKGWIRNKVDDFELDGVRRVGDGWY